MTRHAAARLVGAALLIVAGFGSALARPISPPDLDPISPPPVSPPPNPEPPPPVKDPSVTPPDIGPIKPPDVPPPAFTLSLDRLEPSAVLETAHVHALFTLSNESGQATSGRVQAWLTGLTLPTPVSLGSWPVWSLPTGAKATGAVSFDAPRSAPGYQLQLEYHEAIDGKLRLVKDTAAATVAKRLSPAARFKARLDSFEAVQIRSLLSDTDWASFEVTKPEGTLPGMPVTVGAGKIQAGDQHEVGLESPPFEASTSDPGTLNLSYLVFNQGTSNIQKAVDTAVAILGGLESFHWFDCDGIVARDTASLPLSRLPTDVKDVYQETRTYPGSDSPFGCGSNSLYKVTWSVHRLPVESLRITPDIVRLTPGQIQTFSVSPGVPVQWSVEGGAPKGLVNGQGTYVMPQGLAQNEVVLLRATALDGSGRQAVAAIAPALPFSLDPIVPPPPPIGGINGGGSTGGTTEPPALPQDLNADGSVTVADVIVGLRILLGQQPASDAQRAAADLNGNGQLDIGDIIIILRKTIGL